MVCIDMDTDDEGHSAQFIGMFGDQNVGRTASSIFGNDDEDSAVDGEEVEFENLNLTIQRYHDMHFETLLEHAPPCAPIVKTCDAYIMQTGSTMSGANGTVDCNGSTCQKITKSANAVGAVWPSNIAKLAKLQAAKLGLQPDKYAQLVVPDNIVEVCNISNIPNRAYDMNQALGEPFDSVASKRQPHLIEDPEIRTLSQKVYSRINETLHEMDKLGLYHNDIHAGNIFVHQMDDDVTVYIIDLDEVSELCLMWNVQIYFLIGCGQLDWYLDKAYSQFLLRRDAKPSANDVADDWYQSNEAESRNAYGGGPVKPDTTMLCVAMALVTFALGALGSVRS